MDIQSKKNELQNKNDDNSYTSIETLLNQKNNSDDNSTTTNDDGSVFVGTLYSQISCHTGSLTNFYSCAMEWLENRDTIQPIGCGMTDDDILEERMIVEGEDPSDANHAARESLRLQAIARFKKITTYFLQRYDNMPLMRRTNLPNNHQHSSYTSLRTQSASETDAASSSKTSGMFETDNDPFSSLSSSSVLIPTDLIDMFYTAVTAWDSLSLLGLNIISGNIQTKFKIGTQTENSTTLSSPIVSKEIASPLLHTELVIPRLFDPRFGDNSQVTSDGNILQFDMTVVAQVSKLFVPIRNPSGHAIRVRLTTHATNQPSPIPYPSDGSTTLRSVASEHSIFVQTKPSDKNPWWTGGSYFLTDSHGFLIQSIHNVTIQSSNGAYLSLINPSLYSSSLFLHGCVGRRCGLAVESHHRKDNDEKGDDKKFSRSMGASTSMKDRHIPSSSYTKNHELNLPAFALGLQSTDEIIIPPFGSREVGPVFFRPPGKGNFSCTLWLENSLTGLESITVRGTGGQEKVVFLDNDEESGTLSQKIETRFGQPSLLFSGSRGANGLPELRSVVVANVGDTAVTFDNVYMSSAEVMHFNQRKHKFRSTNIKHRIRNHRFKNCEERGFKLLNCFDENSHGNNNLNGGGLYGYFTSILWTLSHFPFYLSFDKNAVKSKFLGNKSEIINSNIRHGFSLEPNEKRTLYIAHTADCTYQKSFVTLNLEFKGRRNIKVEPMRRNNLNAWEKSFQDDKVELLVGYDMIDTDAKKCRPSTHVTGSVSSFTIEGKLNFDLPNEKLDEPFFYRKVLSPIFLIQLLGTIFFIRHLLELISTSKRRHKSLLLFQGYVTSGENPGDLILRSRIDTSENSSAYRCYSRDEITPSELVQAGKEQTRQSVLSKYKRLGILQPQCIMPNGTFRRERFSIGSAGGSKGESSISKDDRNTTSSSNRSRRVASLNCSSVTLYDSIFSEMRESKQQHSSVENKSILPCGLGWRKITTRGVLSSTLFDIDAITKKNCHKINELLRKRGMMNTISLNSLPAVFPLIDEKPSVRFAMSSIPSQKTNQKSSTLTKTSTPKESILRVKAAPKNETSKKVECLPKKEEKNTTLDEDHKKTDRKVKKEEMKMSSKELIHDNQISKSKVESRNDEKVENKTSNSVKKKVNRKKSVNDNMSDLLLSTDSKSSIEKNVRENRGEAATSLRKGNKASVEKNYFQTNRDQRGGRGKQEERSVSHQSNKKNVPFKVPNSPNIQKKTVDGTNIMLPTEMNWSTQTKQEPSKSLLSQYESNSYKDHQVGNQSHDKNGKLHSEVPSSIFEHINSQSKVKSNETKRVDIQSSFYVPNAAVSPQSSPNSTTTHSSRNSIVSSADSSSTSLLLISAPSLFSKDTSSGSNSEHTPNQTEHGFTLQTENNMKVHDPLMPPSLNIKSFAGNERTVQPPNDSFFSPMSSNQTSTASLRPPPGISPPPGFNSENDLNENRKERYSPPPNTTLLTPFKLGVKMDTLVESVSTNFNESDPEENHARLPETGNESLFGSLLPDQTEPEKEIDGEEQATEPNEMGTELNWLTQINEESTPVHDTHTEEQGESPLLGLGGDFNVINFLNFLDETHHLETDDHSARDMNEEVTSGQDSNDVITKSSTETNYNANIIGLPSNPWSGNPGKSRAAQYGITVETDTSLDHGTVSEVNSATASVSDNLIISHASILQGDESRNDNGIQSNEECNKSEEFFGGDSFFDSLLGD